MGRAATIFGADDHEILTLFPEPADGAWVANCQSIIWPITGDCLDKTAAGNMPAWRYFAKDMPDMELLPEDADLIARFTSKRTSFSNQTCILRFTRLFQ
ncbi:hypothetical protein [uncultured Paracoccus sp.]|uniref:hypothetical protein n=1 Tax=uncultured Paracoccus sp. TaxID=189685 RepID=UPI0025FA7C1F|nr:hypothetical protein [uncultured Paracoccus sp.]